MPEAIAIVGPTASGKSALAVDLALALGGEVVGTDSMQCYAGLDIGTATPTAAERRGVPHHLIDVVPVEHPLSVAEFQGLARDAIAEILTRGRVPIVVGGSGLYVSAVMDDLRFPGTDPVIRARWEAELERLGTEGLHRVLAQRDPAAAAEILSTNGRRIVRALEVGELTGEPFVARLPAPVEVVPARWVGLAIDRETLDARIAARVDAMLAAGFVDEVRAHASALRAAPTASRALGYAQFLAHLDGELTLEQARQATIDATRTFARRQQRWFRRDPRVTWLPYDAADLVDRVLAARASASETDT